MFYQEAVECEVSLNLTQCIIVSGICRVHGTNCKQDQSYCQINDEPHGYSREENI